MSLLRSLCLSVCERASLLMSLCLFVCLCVCSLRVLLSVCMRFVHAGRWPRALGREGAGARHCTQTTRTPKAQLIATARQCTQTTGTPKAQLIATASEISAG